MWWWKAMPVTAAELPEVPGLASLRHGSPTVEKCIRKTGSYIVCHVLGVSSLAAGHKTLVPQVIEELKKLGREDIMVIAGGVIPAQDYDYLYKAGVAAIFGPGSPVAKSACTIMELLMAE